MLWYDTRSQGEAVRRLRAKPAKQSLRSVRQDWSASLSTDMNHVFEATRSDLEISNAILSIALYEALELCGLRQFEYARERAVVFADLFDRLALRLQMVLRTIERQGSHLAMVPNVAPLSAFNFRGVSAQRLSRMSSMLAKVLFRGRTRFFHKLSALEEIIDDLQEETHLLVEELSWSDAVASARSWQEFEVLGYDLNTCMGETTVILKSFFCSLPPEDLEMFRQRLGEQTGSASEARPHRVGEVAKRNR